MNQPISLLELSSAKVSESLIGEREEVVRDIFCHLGTTVLKQILNETTTKIHEIELKLNVVQN